MNVSSSMCSGRQLLLAGEAKDAVRQLQVGLTLLRDIIGNLALPANDQAYFDAYDCTVDLGRAYRAHGDFERATVCFDAAQALHTQAAADR